jgi:hypothetical protein
MDFGMPSESPTCGRTGGDSADAGIEYISPERLAKANNVYWNKKNEVAKATNLLKPLLLAPLLAPL